MIEAERQTILAGRGRFFFPGPAMPLLQADAASKPKFDNNGQYSRTSILRYEKIFGEHYTVSDKIETILQRVASGTRLKFSELFAHVASRVEVVVTFLALLELIRLRTDYVFLKAHALAESVDQGFALLILRELDLARRGGLDFFL